MKPIQYIDVLLKEIENLEEFISNKEQSDLKLLSLFNFNQYIYLII